MLYFFEFEFVSLMKRRVRDQDFLINELDFGGSSWKVEKITLDGEKFGEFRHDVYYDSEAGLLHRVVIHGKDRESKVQTDVRS